VVALGVAAPSALAANAGGKATPPLIGILFLNESNSIKALVKEGSLTAKWNHELSGVQEIAVASDPTNGPLIAALTDSGEAMVKEGSLTAGWNEEHNDVLSISLAG
jgi:hypothetical protein